MKKLITAFTLAVLAAVSFSTAHAQSSDSTGPPSKEAGFKPSGKFTMQLFADYDYLMSADTATGAKGHVPTGKTYYVPVDPQNTDKQFGINQRYFQSFDLRRFYLGYDYMMSKDVGAQVLFSHENGTYLPISSTTDTSKGKDVTTTFGSSSGDIVLDGNRGVYLKAANVQFKNWWMNSNVIFGQQGTAAFGVSENLFGYRSIEKSIGDLRGFAQSNDLGIQAKGSFDQPSLYNYSVMISNGNGAKAENNKYKKFAFEANGWFLDKSLVVELYADYSDVAAGATAISTRIKPDTLKGVDQSNMTIKAVAGYMSDPISIGVEYVMQTQKGQSMISAGTDATPNGLSIFAHGTILNKQLMWFARYDMYDPDSKATGANVDYTQGVSYKENFITAGIDWQPDMSANAHIIPNIWIDTYKDKSATALDRSGITVGRVTFAYKF
jgi:hypothetical protein